MVTSHLRKTHGVVCLEGDTDKNVLRYRVYSKERLSNVHFLDLNSGHNMLSSAAKSISSSGISITPDMVEKTLQNIFPMSPVSLTLIFGPPSLAGLLPWQSIDTEILKWSSHTEMSSSDFINILHTYCAIVKRWGR
ncbi:unnamed protein product [Hymenolepis diminuta]|nr:unnamed protein product [Hymenolepis diminuta]